MDKAPISIPPVARATKCDETLLSSVIKILIVSALLGTSIPISFSVVREKTNSLNKGER